MDEGWLEGLKARLKVYALAIIKAYTQLPKTDEARVMGHQMLRSGTSAGAHHREACRARSTAEFISKMEAALQELDETAYWLDLLVASGNPPQRSDFLTGETDELISIFTTAVRTAKRRRDK